MISIVYAHRHGMAHAPEPAAFGYSAVTRSRHWLPMHAGKALHAGSLHPAQPRARVGTPHSFRLRTSQSQQTMWSLAGGMQTHLLAVCSSFGSLRTSTVDQSEAHNGGTHQQAQWLSGFTHRVGTSSARRARPSCTREGEGRLPLSLAADHLMPPPRPSPATREIMWS